MTPLTSSASSDRPGSPIAAALKSGVAAGGSALAVVPGGLTDRAEHGQPELLGVLLTKVFGIHQTVDQAIAAKKGRR